MRHISEVIDSFLEDVNKSLENKRKQYETVTPPKLTQLEGNQPFWAYVHSLFNHPQFQQFSMFKMHLPEEVAAKLSLKHNQMVEIFSKDVQVKVRPSELWETSNNSFDVAFEPIE